MFTALLTVGRDVEVRFTSGGDAVASVSLAYTYGRKGKDGKRPTQWIDGTIWGKQAESLAPYLTKGTKIVASLDELHIETYVGKDGTEKSKMTGKVVGINFAGKPTDADQPAPPKPKPVADIPDDVPF